MGDKEAKNIKFEFISRGRAKKRWKREGKRARFKITGVNCL